MRANVADPVTDAKAAKSEAMTIGQTAAFDVRSNANMALWVRV